jgi:chromosome partitioning protein
MSRVIAIANQKGGVGKTTTAINLGACLAVAERRVLIVDMDPQGNATSGIGVDRSTVITSAYEVLVEGARATDAVVRAVHFPLLDILPSSRDLVGAEVELVGRHDRELMLRRALEPLRDDYDLVLIDCPPSLGLLTLNTLAAADAVMIPIQCEFYALEGLSQLLNTVRLVQRNLNPGLQIDGVLLTMHDQRLNLSRQVADEAHEYFGSRVYRTVIPRNVRLAEAPSFGKPIILYDVLSPGAKSYLALAQEVLGRARRGADDAAGGRHTPTPVAGPGVENGSGPDADGGPVGPTAVPPAASLESRDR